MDIYLVNVGVNTSHEARGLRSPLFEDGTFEFLPIPEKRLLTGSHIVRYRDLRSFYRPSESLLPFIPSRFHDWPAHSDPEFSTFTYGDRCEASPRASALRRMRPGDVLLFLARLVPPQHSTSSQSRRAQNKQGAFYLIGFFVLEKILGPVRGPLNSCQLARFRNNAHARRARSDSHVYDGFWLFGGGRGSQRFLRAVSFTRELAQKVLRDAQGRPLDWREGASDLMRLGMYTRTARRILSTDDPEEARRLRVLAKAIEAANPGAAANLMRQ